MEEFRLFEEPRRKRVRWIKCDICGYVWESYGYGKRILCPQCTERRTGRKPGRDAEGMAKMREAQAKKRAEKAAAAGQITAPIFEDADGETGTQPRRSLSQRISDFLDRKL